MPNATLVDTNQVSVGTSTNPLFVNSPGYDTPATVKSGQYKLTASAVSIGSQALVNGVALKAKSTNTGPCWVGPSGVTITDDGTGNGFKLYPGDTVSIAVANVSAVYAIGTANDVLYWFGN